jgi:uncharacterized membrane protein (DUF373 family)
MLKRFEKMIVYCLIGLMMVVILLTTIELGWIMATDILRHPRYLLEIDQILEIFGLFLLILIGVELLETIKAYLAEHVVHTEIVLEVALIAIARKVIILDVKDLPPMTLIAIAALVVTLAVAYYLERSTRKLGSGAEQTPKR